MNRYPLWKYITVLMAFVIGLLYTLPNFYGESPAVQVSSAMSTVRVEPAILDNIRHILDENKIPYEGVFFEQNGPTGTVRARFDSTDTKLQARDLIERTLNTDPAAPRYTIALNLLPASP